MVQVEIRDLEWRVPAGVILRGISARVGEGEFVGLVGPNGAGKSSVLRCVYRLYRPSAGAVLLDGTDVWELSARESARRSAAVLQETPAAFGLTVAEIVGLGRVPHRGSAAGESVADRQLIEEAIHLVGLDGFADRSFGSLSGGEKQRANFARALVQQPKLLILDEPTNHLDIRYQRDVLRLTRKLGVTVLASFHDLNLAAAYCDRLYVVAKGGIVAAGTPAEILTPALIESVFMVAARVSPHPDTARPCITYEP